MKDRENVQLKQTLYKITNSQRHVTKHNPSCKHAHRYVNNTHAYGAWFKGKVPWIAQSSPCRHIAAWGPAGLGPSLVPSRRARGTETPGQTGRPRNSRSSPARHRTVTNRGKRKGDTPGILCRRPRYYPPACWSPPACLVPSGPLLWSWLTFGCPLAFWCSVAQPPRCTPRKTPLVNHFWIKTKLQFKLSLCNSMKTHAFHHQ